MGRKLYVGNLSYSATGQDLESIFKDHGTVTSASVATDRETGRSRGFGFVEMSTDEEAEAAVNALNGTNFQGRQLKVNEARPRPAGGGGGGGGRGGHGGEGGGGGRRRW